MRRTSRFLPAIPTLFLAVLLGPGGAWAVPAASLARGTASGTVSLDGKAVSLHYGYAMAQPNQIDEKKTDTSILLTEKPIPEKGFEALVYLEMKLQDAARAQSNWILLQLDQDGRPIREVVHTDALEGDLESAGTIKSDFTLGTRTKDRIEGALQTKNEEEFLKHKYATRIRFNAAIRPVVSLPGAKNGAKLAAGGGEPGKAYHEFFRNERIDDGYVNGDIAVLYVTARGQYGTVRMSRIDGVWKLGPRKWSDHPPVK
jgi:hypothetical protein